MARSAHVAIDLGAESGRVIVGVLDDGVLRTHEVHRFEHGPVRLPGGLFWDVTGFWREILRGLASAVRWARAEGTSLRSVGVDTWGVDFALLDGRGELVGLPHCYRDEQHEAARDAVLTMIPEQEIYATTGVRTMALNTLYQLHARTETMGDTIQSAGPGRVSSLLFMPDYFHFLLSGVRKNEASIASTSQMVDRSCGGWATGMLGRLGLPVHVLGEVVKSGTVLGPIRAEIADEIGLAAGERRRLLVVTPGSHDTASAIAAVPAKPGTSWAYLSSGTWSLMGVELDRPCITEEARTAGFTNEVGVGGTVRFLKNIVGLWMVQECRRDLERQGRAISYAALTDEAAGAEPFRTLLDPEHTPFLQPGDMLEKIRVFARAASQPEPRTPGEFVRCCLESLALSYRLTLAGLGRVTSRRIDVLHVVGGGGKNRLLNQMTADACDRPVVVGPLEATATGNILVQAIGLGLARDPAELREIVARSQPTEVFAPKSTTPWPDAEGRLARLVADRRTSVTQPSINAPNAANTFRAQAGSPDGIVPHHGPADLHHEN